MSFYILRRILYAIPIAFGVSVVCFSLVYIAPGDPLQTVMPPDATAETIEIVKKAYGFDKPLPMQFLIWLGRVLTGDFGMSISTRRRGRCAGSGRRPVGRRRVWPRTGVSPESISTGSVIAPRSLPSCSRASWSCRGSTRSDFFPNSR